MRFHSAEWQIDPQKIGVPGFSAGGHLVAAISNHFERRFYPAVDAAHKESCRPDFAVAIYPGHLSLHAPEWDAKQGAKKVVVQHNRDNSEVRALVHRSRVLSGVAKGIAGGEITGLEPTLEPVDTLG